MASRWSAMPPGLRQTVFSYVEFSTHRATSRNTFVWTRRAHTAAPTPTLISQHGQRNLRKYLWLVPVGGGLALYLSPKPRSLIADILYSPTIIPCNGTRKPPPEPPISSPAEPNRSIVSQVICFFRECVWEPVLTARRLAYLLILFVPVLLTSPMLLVGNPERELGGDRWGAVWWYEFLTAQMQRAGPTFVKLGQWAASRADLFPTLLCDRMGSLHSRGKAHPYGHTRHVIEHVFQRPFEEVFEEFDATPIGTGAIAQVYRAKLRNDLIPPSHLTPKRPHPHGPAALAPAILHPPEEVPTNAVAIKILHPKVEKLISRDLKIMAFFANALTFIPGVQWLSLPEEVEVFGRMMREQLDLRNESHNLVEFEKRFADRRLPVTFPRPLEVWSTRDMLVEEYQNALSLEDFLRNGGGPYNDTLAEVGLDAFLNMLLLDNFVHSDLHPGNIMIKFTKPQSTTILLKNAWNALWKSKVQRVKEDLAHAGSMFIDPMMESIVDDLRGLRKDPAAWRAELQRVHDEGYLPEIVFIDAGLVTTLDSTNRRNFLDLFRAIAEFDGYRAGELMVERCRTPELAVDPETFALKMQHIVLQVKRKTFSLGQIKISDILHSVLKAVREHHVKMEADFVNTVISVLLLEGIGRQLDPGLDLFKSALPILRQLGRQMSTQENLKQMERSNLGAFLKVWVYMEARELASSALVDADELVKYDWLTPSI
ncbi:ADCK2-like domain-containing protein [Phanerochaete sordida]|uniref:ADCK2-like domain-containing protein n=1 Tax=Phanerochaete sordida TaxID=48140 RepID=A0A9P3G0F7_9APHY|nr:ADCK2-like domain-containing protein [Phanerochaete sordida]